MAETISSFLIWYLVFVFSVTTHEFAHSLFAYWGGDLTAYEGGTMSLDPVPHMKRSPFGMVVVPILSFILGGSMIGWASAPVDPRWSQRFPRRSAAMSAAGPCANFILAAIAFFTMKLLVSKGVLVFSRALSMDAIVSAPDYGGLASTWGVVAMALSILLTLNILLGVLNLLPLPPLDGAFVLEGLFPKTVGPLLYRLRTNPMMMLLLMIVIFRGVNYIFTPVLALVLHLLMS
ncbi:MAG: site-2 protease family protein [Polyangiaceae bacterium]|nr:site-2 protease family protein [Polyangiaceae bacterium]